MITKDKLRSLAEQYLLPFFSGAKIELGVSSSSSREQRVAYRDPCNIDFKVEKTDTYRLTLQRSQPFYTSISNRVPEIDVVQAFVDVVRDMQDAIGKPYELDLLATFQRRIVAKAVANPDCQNLVLESLDHMDALSTRLYEGRPVAACIGIADTMGELSAKPIRKIWEKDFCTVITNGFDTLLEIGKDGKLIAHRSLTYPGSASFHSPNRLAPIADWAAGKKIAIVLNRLGEILVMKDHRLVFARRSGAWHFVSLDPLVSQMSLPADDRIRKAILETCLDASFARTGACIGVVGSGSSQMAEYRRIVQENDQLRVGKSQKTIALQRMINKQSFHSLDRRFRQELVAIDGATIINYKGEILAVGAILKIGGGSTGGGRLAAAKALCKAGVGIKVSQDGGVLGFVHKSSKPKFYLL